MRIQLHEAIVAAVRDRMRDVYTAIPGRIEKYDFTTGSAQVKPLIQEIQDGTGKYKPLPVIAGVPVMQPGGQAASLSMPVTVGDTGLLVFTKHALEVWLSLGGDVAPGDPRQFDLSDAIFIPGLRTFVEPQPAESAEALVLKNGTAKLKIENGTIALGNPVTPLGPIELIDLLTQLLTVLITGVNAGGPVTFTPPAGPGSVPDILLKLTALKGSL